MSSISEKEVETETKMVPDDVVEESKDVDVQTAAVEEEAGDLLLKKRPFSEITPSSNSTPLSSSNESKESNNEIRKKYVPVPKSATFDWWSPIARDDGYSFAQGLKYRHDQHAIEHQNVFKKKGRHGQSNLVRTFNYPLPSAFPSHMYHNE